MYGKYAYEKYEGEAMKPVTEFNDCYIDFLSDSKTERLATKNSGCPSSLVATDFNHAFSICLSNGIPPINVLKPSFLYVFASFLACFTADCFNSFLNSAFDWPEPFCCLLLPHAIRPIQRIAKINTCFVFMSNEFLITTY